MALVSALRRAIDERAEVVRARMPLPSRAEAAEFSVEMEELPSGELARSAVGRDWAQLEAKTCAPIFLSWLWIGSWLAEIVGDRSVIVARVIDKKGQLVAISLIAVVEERWGGWPSRVAYINELPHPKHDMIIEQNGCLALKGWEVRAFKGILEAIVNADLGVEEVRCRRIHERFYAAVTDPSFSLPYIMEQSQSEWVIDSRSSLCKLDDLVSMLSKNKRWQIRRFQRLAEEKYGPLSVVAADSLESAEEFFTRLAALHTEYWRGKGRLGVFSNEKWRLFHLCLIKSALPFGKVQLLKIMAGSFEVGYLYNVVSGNEIVNIQSGFRYLDDDNRWRPGYMSHLLAAVVGVRDGFYRYNLLVGDDSYKSSIADRGAAAYWFSVYPSNGLNKRYVIFRLVEIGRRIKRFLMGLGVWGSRPLARWRSGGRGQRMPKRMAEELALSSQREVFRDS